MDVSLLPHVNAALNAVAAVLLTFGYIFIRTGRIPQHRAMMISAACVSGLFLISYVTYRLNAPIFVFAGHGWIRPVYYVLLASHVALAMVMVPMVALTLTRALKRQFPRHRRVARLTWPVWMYVSVTGIIVYVMLYQIYPAGGAAS